MTPQEELLLERICAEPTRSDAPVALYRELIQESTLKAATEIAEATIEAYLRKHPELVRQWLGLSENQRSSPNWYLQEEKPNQWLVGYYPPDSSKPRKRYHNGFEAVAFFIKRHIEGHAAFASWEQEAKRQDPLA